MAKDDMRVIMYKILRYLYRCNKEGIKPNFVDMCYNCKLYSIQKEYWAQIMLELIELGYIKGFIVISTKDGVNIQPKDTARITLSGVDYLEENSAMKKVKEFLGEAFEILLESIISLAK